MECITLPCVRNTHVLVTVSGSWTLLHQRLFTLGLRKKYIDQIITWIHGSFPALGLFKPRGGGSFSEGTVLGWGRRTDKKVTSDGATRWPLLRILGCFLPKYCRNFEPTQY